MHPFCRCLDCPYIPNRKAVRAARDENGKTIFVPSDMTYGEWYRKYVDKFGKGDIISAGSNAVTISSINKPIEQRNTGKGNPNAILLFNVELSNRQKRLLDKLPNYDSKVIVDKSDVNLADLSALTAKEGVEFAMFTKKNERLIIRGNEYMVNIDEQLAKKLSKEGYRWSGHTHPGDTMFVLFASDGDKQILKCFNQLRSVIMNSKGQFNVFRKE